jgi:hypothetical protein
VSYEARSGLEDAKLSERVDSRKTVPALYYRGTVMSICSCILFLELTERRHDGVFVSLIAVFLTIV